MVCRRRASGRPEPVLLPPKASITRLDTRTALYDRVRFQQSLPKHPRRLKGPVTRPIDPRARVVGRCWLQEMMFEQAKSYCQSKVCATAGRSPANVPPFLRRQVLCRLMPYHAPLRPIHGAGLNSRVCQHCC